MVLVSCSDVVLNEIMYAPSAPEPEWVEILNRGNEPVNLKRWQISDATATRHVLPSLDIVLPAGGYLLLTKDSSALHDARGAPPCAVSASLAFPRSTTAAMPWCCSMRRDARWTASSIVRSGEACKGGCSLERRDADASSTEPGNWGTCASASGATPGLPEFHSCGSAMTFSWLEPVVVAGSTDTLVAVIRNAENMPAAGFALMVYDDSDFDSLGGARASWPVDGRRVSPCSRAIQYPYAWRYPCSPGVHQLIAVADFPVDERPADNHARLHGGAPVCSAVPCSSMRSWPIPSREEANMWSSSMGARHDIDVKGWGVTDLAGSDGRGVDLSCSACRPSRRVSWCSPMDSTFLEQFPSLATGDQRLVVVLRAGSSQSEQ